MKKFLLKNPYLVVMMVVLGVAVLLAQSSQNSPNSKLKATTQNLAKFATDIVSKCASSPYHPTCYDEQIPRLMDHPTNLSLEQAFEVTREVQNQDSSYRYCHVLGHELSAKETKKDPSRWKEVITRCPSGLCSNGCIHGSFQERFRTDSLSSWEIDSIKPDLENVCEARANWQPTGLEQASCYHALGHLTMYMTGADIQKSLSLCQDVALKGNGRDFTRVCTDGVFMQIFQPLEPEDFDLVRGKQPSKDNLLSFCSPYSGMQRGSCISESWPLFRSELMDGPAGVVKFCSMEEPGEQGRCYSGIIYVMTAQLNFDLDKLFSYCSGLPAERRGECFGNVAGRLNETDYRNITQSVDFCQDSLTVDQSGQCFDELVKQSTFNFKAGSEQFLELCNGMPDPWKAKCLARS